MNFININIIQVSRWPSLMRHYSAIYSSWNVRNRRAWGGEVRGKTTPPPRSLNLAESMLTVASGWRRLITHASSESSDGLRTLSKLIYRPSTVPTTSHSQPGWWAHLNVVCRIPPSPLHTHDQSCPWVGLSRGSEMADLRKTDVYICNCIVKQLFCFVKTYTVAHHCIFCIWVRYTLVLIGCFCLLRTT